MEDETWMERSTAGRVRNSAPGPGIRRTAPNRTRRCQIRVLPQTQFKPYVRAGLHFALASILQSTFCTLHSSQARPFCGRYVVLVPVKRPQVLKRHRLGVAIKERHV